MKRVGMVGVIAFVACGRSAPAPAPMPPAPAPAPLVQAPPSLETVRAFRTAGQLDQYEAGLKQLTVSSTDVKTRGRAEALLALDYLDHNRHDEAVPYLKRAADDDPVIAPWMWVRIGDLEWTNRVLQVGLESTASVAARLHVTGLFAEAHNADATTMALGYTNLIAINEVTDDGFQEMVRTLAKNDRTDLATAVRFRFLTEYPQSKYTEENYAALAALNPSPLDALPLDRVVEIAKKLGGAEHYDEALDLMNRFAKRSPAEAATPEFRDLRWRSLFNSRHYADLVAEMNEKSLRDPALMLLRARALWRLNKSEELLAGLKRIEREFPHSPEATEAKIIRAKYYTVDDPKLDLAIANLKEIVGAGTYGTEGEHLWTLGWTYLLAHRDEDALRTFAEYKAQFPDGDYLMNALFWTGKIQERLGHAAERDAAWDDLEKLYPYNYFSYRARELRHQPTVAPSEIANGNTFPDLADQRAKLQIHETDPLEVIDELLWLGLYREAIPDIKQVIEVNKDNAAAAMMLAETYAQAGLPAYANGILQHHFHTFIRHGGSGIPQQFWQLLYPLAYWDVIQREAAKQHVDPYLLASIARQESLFEPSTVSNAGAVGVMQIMPQEAARIAAAAGLQAPTRDQLFDPATNIAIGAAEYAQKRSAVNGNDILAIAAYNAGTDVVGKWLAQTPVDDGDVFVESIPYNETRLYVKTVTRNRFEYRRIYENGGSSQSAAK